MILCFDTIRYQKVAYFCKAVLCSGVVKYVRGVESVNILSWRSIP